MQRRGLNTQGGGGSNSRECRGGGGEDQINPPPPEKHANASRSTTKLVQYWTKQALSKQLLLYDIYMTLQVIFNKKIALYNFHLIFLLERFSLIGELFHHNTQTLVKWLMSFL